MFIGMTDELPELRVPPVTVRVRLHHGDARAIVAPVAVIGDRSPIRTWLEQEHGAVFEPTAPRFWPSPTRAGPAWQASPKSGPWRYVMSVRTNVRRQRGTKLASDLSDTLVSVIKPWAPFEIVILPLTWRDPDVVAMNTLLALWLIATYSDFFFGGPWPDPQFTLATLDTTDGTDLYRAALRNNATAFYDWLTPIWERDVITLMGPQNALDRGKVIFDWVENS